VLTELTPEEAVALLSALVFQERGVAAPSPGGIPPALEAAAHHATALARAAGETQRDAGLQLVPDDYIKNTLNFGLMEVRSSIVSATTLDSVSHIVPNSSCICQIASCSRDAHLTTSMQPSTSA